MVEIVLIILFVIFVLGVSTFVWKYTLEILKKCYDKDYNVKLCNKKIEELTDDNNNLLAKNKEYYDKLVLAGIIKPDSKESPTVATNITPYSLVENILNGKEKI